jgi:uncharacterized Zn finger protein (UPF0148 family)
MYKSFKPPGVYLTDIAKWTGCSQVKKYCEAAGVELYQLDGKTYCPLSLQQTYLVLKQIRAAQGNRLLSRLTDSTSDVKK